MQGLQPHPNLAGLLMTDRDAGAGGDGNAKLHGGKRRVEDAGMGKGEEAQGKRLRRTHGQAGAQHDHVVGLVHGAGYRAASPRPSPRGAKMDRGTVARLDPFAGKRVPFENLSAAGNRPGELRLDAVDAQGGEAVRETRERCACRVGAPSFFPRVMPTL